MPPIFLLKMRFYTSTIGCASDVYFNLFVEYNLCSLLLLLALCGNNSINYIKFTYELNLYFFILNSCRRYWIRTSGTYYCSTVFKTAGLNRSPNLLKYGLVIYVILIIHITGGFEPTRALYAFVSHYVTAQAALRYF